jgi:hypothetical protein
MLRALLNVITGLPYGERLDLFGNFMKKQRPDIFEQMQKHTGSSAKVQADTIAAIVQAKGKIIMEDLGVFNSVNRDGVFTEYDEQIDYRKNNRLRARYSGITYRVTMWAKNPRNNRRVMRPKYSCSTSTKSTTPTLAPTTVSTWTIGATISFGSRVH